MSSLARRLYHATPSQEKTSQQTHFLRLLLLGSPGAGKGTQAARIQKNFPVIAISSGDILRRNIQEGTEIGRVAQDVMNRGSMVPDQIMVDLIDKELSKTVKKNWLLDGFPRSVAQAQNLDVSLEKNEQPLNIVIHLDVPAEVILERIMDRWVHVPSGRVYSSQYNPPVVPERDDITGEKLVRRPDDNPDVFKIRQQKYRDLMQPLLEYYDKQSLLIKATGNTSDEIYPIIEDQLHKRLCRPLSLTT